MKAFLFVLALIFIFPTFALELAMPFPSIAKNDLPLEARQKLQIIQSQGAPYPFREDGTVFHNLHKRLPHSTNRTFYKRFIVPDSNGKAHPQWRLVQGGNAFYFSRDNFKSFLKIED